MNNGGGKKLLTYISLFSSAGVGCHGFSMESFECIATSELIERRLNVQKANNKCRYETGYISGDLTKPEIKSKIYKEVDFWKKHHKAKDVDVLISTPPCQGMSVANHKKKNELPRNSLMVESIELIEKIKPKIFIFENVRAFLDSFCLDLDGNTKKIRQAIEDNLDGNYNIAYKVLNFKDYGNPTSRTRTIVIGARKDIQDVDPYDLMPDEQPERTLREIIGDLQPLISIGEISEKDIYHQFRPYAEHMLDWIKDLKEGESAFDNKNPEQRPHRIIDGKVVSNQNKNGDKYSRCFWDKPGPCIHTRNDIMSSQSTVHPRDNRVFSIRELMRMMSIPGDFKWAEIPEKILNSMTLNEKKAFLKKEEANIRQSLGEAVPTIIFHQIAKKIKNNLADGNLTIPKTNVLIKKKIYFSQQLC
jgi:DNA (cytosine-5)-methyltransferase 1